MTKQTRVVLTLLGLALCAGLRLAQAAEPGVTDTEILVGQPAGITGPLAELAPDILDATKALFDSVNDKGRYPRAQDPYADHG